MRRGWMILLLALIAVALLTYGCTNRYVTSGKISMNARRWDKAISDFNKALEIEPGNAKAHFYLAKVYGEKGEYILMAQHLATADSLDPKLDSEASRLRDSTWYAIAGTADSAMSEAGTMEKDAAANFKNALDHISSNQSDSAVKSFERTKSSLRIKDKTKADTLYASMVAIAKAGQIETAQSLFDSVLITATYPIYVDAKNKFETSILIAPKRPESYAKCGFAWFKLGNDDSSFYYYKGAYNLAPENMEILSNLIRIGGRLGKLSMVDSLCAKVLAKDPKNVEALLRRGEIAEVQERFDDAIKYYTLALDIKPDQCNIWFTLGVIYFQKVQKLDEAEQAFSKAADLCPDDPNALINLCVILITNNKIDDAISKLTIYTDQNPKDCVGWDLLAQAFARKGYQDKATEADKKYKDCKGIQ